MQRVARELQAPLAFRQVAAGDGTFHCPAAVPAIISGGPAPLGLQAALRLLLSHMADPLNVSNSSKLVRNNRPSLGVDQPIYRTRAQLDLRMWEQRFAGTVLQPEQLILDGKDCSDERPGTGQRRSRQG